MAFKIPTVERCPVARRTIGVIEISPDILADLAGAVSLDRDEWLIALMGERKMNGLHVVVDNYFVPTNQKRASATCSIDQPLPVNIAKRTVGVLHSHNNMGARFSGTDRGEGGLNQTFPMSIVISSSVPPKDERADEYRMLGFAYEAEGRFQLPCGSLGVADFRIIPHGYKDWPFMVTPSIPVHAEGTEFPHLSDCQSWDQSPDSTRYTLKRLAKCGIKEKEGHTRARIFGFDGDNILRRLPEAQKITYVHGGQNLPQTYKTQSSSQLVRGGGAGYGLDEEDGKVIEIDIDGYEYFEEL